MKGLRTWDGNAEYLRGLVARKDSENGPKGMQQVDGETRWLVSSQWNAAVQYALAASLTSSVRDLQVLNFEETNNVISKTKDAVVLLQDVLLGKHDCDIEETLDQFNVSRSSWWSAFYRVIEGLAEMSRLGRNGLQQSGNGLEDASESWDDI